MTGAHAAGVVTGVETLTFPFWLPDEDETPARPRYIGTYRLYIHPSPS